MANLFIYKLKQKELRLLIQDAVVSHYTWVSNDRILYYGNYDQKILGYYFISILDWKISYAKKIKQNIGDGHPVVKDNIIFFDTYPGINSFQELYAFNGEKNKLLGRFYHSYKFRGEYRCDLHPVIGHHSGNLYIDTVYNGTRQLVSLSIGRDL